MRRTLAILVAGSALGALGALAAAQPSEAGLLDGKRFDVTVTERGKESGDPDTLIFADGTFRSEACDAYGFELTPYTAERDGGEVAFEAAATSESEGTNRWQGRVLDDGRISGTFVWTKPGQDAVTYTFDGMLTADE